MYEIGVQILWTFICHQDQANLFIPCFVYNLQSVSLMFSVFINMGTQIFLKCICPLLGRSFKIKQWVAAVADREIYLYLNQLPAIFFSPDIQLSNWELKLLKYRIAKQLSENTISVLVKWKFKSFHASTCLAKSMDIARIRNTIQYVPLSSDSFRFS